MELVIVGGGRMGEALLGGLLAGGFAHPSELAVVEAVDARRRELTARYPGVSVGEAPVGAAGVVVAVKPADVAGACAGITEAIRRDGGATRVLSIAAGVTTATLEAALPPGTPVVRSMPNVAALVGAAASAIAGGSAAAPADLAWAATVLGSVGEVVEVPERLLDAVTGLSGSGPGYVFLVVEALIEGGVLAGLPREISVRLATATLLGSARLLAETGETAEALRAQVTSPGGTTAAGLRALEAAGVRSAFIEAVTAATERARQLGG
jgi:pyrroline-5-carboxylate reductase